MTIHDFKLLRLALKRYDKYQHTPEISFFIYFRKRAKSICELKLCNSNGENCREKYLSPKIGLDL